MNRAFIIFVSLVCAVLRTFWLFIRCKTDVPTLHRVYQSFNYGIYKPIRKRIKGARTSFFIWLCSTFRAGVACITLESERVILVGQVMVHLYFIHPIEQIQGFLLYIYLTVSLFRRHTLIEQGLYSGLYEDISYVILKFSCLTLQYSKLQKPKRPTLTADQWICVYLVRNQCYEHKGRCIDILSIINSPKEVEKCTFNPLADHLETENARCLETSPRP